MYIVSEQNVPGTPVSSPSSESRSDSSSDETKTQEFTASEVADALVMGICFGHGTKAFSRAFGQVRIDDYFGEHYDVIRLLLCQKLNDDFIAMINSGISTIATWIMDVYLPKQTSGATKEELNSILEPKVSYDLLNIVYKLMDHENAEICLCPFIISAAMYITLLQQLVLMDPDVEDPADSEYVPSIEIESETFRDHVSECYRHIRSVRLSFVGQIKEKLSRKPITLATGRIARMSGVIIWVDDFTGYEHDNESRRVAGVWSNGDMRTLRIKSVEDRNAYLNVTMNEMNEQLGHPQLAVGAFKRTSDYPLPDKRMTATCEEIDDMKHKKDESRKPKDQEFKSKSASKEITREEAKLVIQRASKMLNDQIEAKMKADKGRAIKDQSVVQGLSSSSYKPTPTEQTTPCPFETASAKKAPENKHPENIVQKGPSSTFLSETGMFPKTFSPKMKTSKMKSTDKESSNISPEHISLIRSQATVKNSSANASVKSVTSIKLSPEKSAYKAQSPQKETVGQSPLAKASPIHSSSERVSRDIGFGDVMSDEYVLRKLQESYRAELVKNVRDNDGLAKPLPRHRLSPIKPRPENVIFSTDIVSGEVSLRRDHVANVGESPFTRTPQTSRYCSTEIFAVAGKLLQEATKILERKEKSVDVNAECLKATGGTEGQCNSASKLALEENSVETNRPSPSKRPVLTPNKVILNSTTMKLEPLAQTPQQNMSEKASNERFENSREARDTRPKTTMPKTSKKTKSGPKVRGKSRRSS